MRPIPSLLALAALALAAAARADPAPPLAPDPVQTYYPPAALAAKVAGQVVLACGHDEHAALKDCTLVSETPAGQGFGAAALAMAAAARGNPRLSITDPGFLAPSPLAPLVFTPDPPSITPDFTRMPHALTQPEVVAPPPPDAMQSVYPPQALRDRVAGKVVLSCAVTAASRVTDCAVLEEVPPDQGFGDAALKIAPQFQVNPLLRDGDPIDGGHIVLPIAFGPH